MPKTNNNWKELIRGNTWKFDNEGDYSEWIIKIVETEIIEKLIEDIEQVEIKYRDDYANDIVSDTRAEIEQQLRDKWL